MSLEFESALEIVDLFRKEIIRYIDLQEKRLEFEMKRDERMAAQFELRKKKERRLAAAEVSDDFSDF